MHKKEFRSLTTVRQRYNIKYKNVDRCSYSNTNIKKGKITNEKVKRSLFRNLKIKIMNIILNKKIPQAKLHITYTSDEKEKGHMETRMRVPLCLVR